MLARVAGVKVSAIGNALYNWIDRFCRLAAFPKERRADSSRWKRGISLLDAISRWELKVAISWISSDQIWHLSLKKRGLPVLIEGD